MPEQPKGQLALFEDSYDTKLNAWNFRRLLAQKYDVVVTNPPYRGIADVNAKLSDFVKKNYTESKSDLFAAFIERCDTFLTPRGMQSMITMESWMFLSSFEKLRLRLFATKTIVNLVHMPYLGKGGTSLGINFGTSMFVLQKGHLPNFQGQYMCVRYYETDEEGVPFAFPTVNERYKAAAADNFANIPGSPVSAYWVGSNGINNFSKARVLSDVANPRQGLISGDVNRFVRIWWECALPKIGFNSETETAKWFPYNNGGEYRKWYGNNADVVNWENNGFEIRNFVDDKGKQRSRPQNQQFYFNEGGTWTAISSGAFSVRYFPEGYLFSNAGMAMFGEHERLLYLVAMLNTKLCQYYLRIFSETLNYNQGDIARLPIIIENEDGVNTLATATISLSRSDWDSFETSWDFTRHPFVTGKQTVTAAFAKWESEAAERFDTLKANEEELNRIFINIYGLQDELDATVEDKDVTVRRADLGREIRSLISYAVGCMLGRYSLDVNGLAYAGGDWDAGKYQTFPADKDNILPLCDDEYFDDDILGRFVDFVKTVYGVDTLEENLRFIADALGGKGTPREVIRNYFLNDFYKDHLKIYQKRPIYWLFDSGKKNGFKALIYMHRYSSDLLAKLRTDYVHEQQERYRTQLSHIIGALNTATGAERARLLKQQDKLTEQLREITAFEEKVHHLADQNITIDLDDGVMKNYEIFADVLAKF
ncbi:MAG: BREX-1 system adenine-specific DNA-methyltransferase PglX [Paenibacillaceae bacterium]